MGINSVSMDLLLAKLDAARTAATGLSGSAGPAKAAKAPRDVFAYVIHEGKVRAPAGAMELIARVS